MSPKLRFNPDSNLIIFKKYFHQNVGRIKKRFTFVENYKESFFEVMIIRRSLVVK